MWMCMDYMGVPQILQSSDKADDRVTASDSRFAGSDEADLLAKAVRSIPAYIERASYVLVLAPFAQHGDTGEFCAGGTWSRRGWCRLELWSARLSDSSPPILMKHTVPGLAEACLLYTSDAADE